MTYHKSITLLLECGFGIETLFLFQVGKLILLT